MFDHFEFQSKDQLDLHIHLLNKFCYILTMNFYKQVMPYLVLPGMSSFSYLLNFVTFGLRNQGASFNMQKFQKKNILLILKSFENENNSRRNSMVVQEEKRISSPIQQKKIW